MEIKLAFLFFRFELNLFLGHVVRAVHEYGFWDGDEDEDIWSWGMRLGLKILMV